MDKDIEKAVHPVHYDSKIQVIDFAIANNLGFLEGNIVKYVTRYKAKNGVEDLYKAQVYLQRLIDAVERDRIQQLGGNQH